MTTRAHGGHNIFRRGVASGRQIAERFVGAVTGYAEQSHGPFPRSQATVGKRLLKIGHGRSGVIRDESIGRRAAVSRWNQRKLAHGGGGDWVLGLLMHLLPLPMVSRIARATPARP
jgi:hypothetical protein